MNRLTEGYCNIVTGTTANLSKISSISLTVMMFVTTFDVVLRYFFSMPITGSYEINEYMMVTLVAFGMAHAAVHDEHISVDLLSQALKPSTRSLILCITRLLCFELFILIAWRLFLLAGEYLAGGDVSTNLSIPVYPFAYLLAFGSLLTALVFLNDLIDLFSELLKDRPISWRLNRLALVIIVFLLFLFPFVGNDVPFQADAMTAGIIGLVLLLFLLFSEMPVGIVMGLVGFLGMVYISGLKPGLNILGTTAYSTSSSYSLSVIPLFVLMGAFCMHAGLSRDLYYAFYKLLGHLRGGLAMATVVSCAFFAAVTGSSVATTATMGMVALPEMKKYKYGEGLAAGSIAAGGSLGVLIPPSVILVIYAILTQQSIGKLFIAGIIPGILEVLFYMITIYLICRIYPSQGPKTERRPYKEMVVAMKDVWGIIVLFVLVIGGIYIGIFTPTEAAGVGAFGAMLFAIGRRKLKWKNFVSSLDETVKTTAMVFVILIGANIFGYFLAVSRLPYEMVASVGQWDINPHLIMIGILFIYLILGAFISALAMIVLTVPILFPLIQNLGFDPIWFGIIIVRVVEMGQITPPVGINVYVLKGSHKELSLQTIFKGVTPFLVADTLHIALLMVFPQIVMFLPNLM